MTLCFKLQLLICLIMAWYPDQLTLQNNTFSKINNRIFQISQKCETGRLGFKMVRLILEVLIKW